VSLMFFDATVTLGRLAVFAILLARRRTARFPVFTTYIAFAIMQMAIQFTAYRTGVSYFWTSNGLGIIDMLLQLGVVYEIIGEVCDPTDTGSRQARTTLLILGLLSVFIAGGLAVVVEPRERTALLAWSIRFDLFKNLLIAELLTALILVAERKRLFLHNWVSGIAEGLALSVLTSLLIAVLHAYWGLTQWHFALECLRDGAFLLASVRWFFSFWQMEPERRPLPSEIRKQLSALSRDLNNGASTLDEITKKTRQP
jgi:hypothetical protein